MKSRAERSPVGRILDGPADFAVRLADALTGKKAAAIAREIDVAPSSLQRYLSGSIPAADTALKLARALGVSAEWLIAGTGPREPTTAVGGSAGARLFDASSADWVFVPRYRFDMVMTAISSVVIETYPMRRDWLKRSLGTAEGIWVTEMPTSDMPSVAEEGETIICRNDYEIREGLAYVFALDGQLVVRRVDVDPQAGLVLRTDDPDKVPEPLSDQLPGLALIGRVLAKISLSPVPVRLSTTKGISLA